MRGSRSQTYLLFENARRDAYLKLSSIVSSDINYICICNWLDVTSPSLSMESTPLLRIRLPLTQCPSCDNGKEALAEA